MSEQRQEVTKSSSGGSFAMQQSENLQRIEKLKRWCSEALGPCAFVSDDVRIHGRSCVYRIQASNGFYYVKVHQDELVWAREVHGYEQWAQPFGAHCPQLVAVHDEAPYALLVSELPGQPLAGLALSREKEQQVWQSAGAALAQLHELTTGEYFGPCDREGAPVGRQISDAVEYVDSEFDMLTDSGLRGGFLSTEELAVVRRARGLVSAFAGESAVPCHRDYGPDNWLVLESGEWSGVIDFELAYWDPRAADFSRYPNWEWMHRPELLESFFAGYGHSLTPKEEQQCLVLRTQYALGAIVWGRENSFFGFEAEGRQALSYLAKVV